MGGSGGSYIGDNDIDALDRIPREKIREGDKLNSILNVSVVGKGGQVRPVALWVCPQCGTISVPLNCHFESERIVEPVGVSVPNKIII